MKHQKPFKALKSLQVFFNYILNNKGMTLVEVIISLAILGMIFAGVQLFNHYGLISFNIGSTQTNLQQELRIADKFITNEVRYATEIEILEKAPESFDEKYNYIFLGVKGNIISSKGTSRKTIVNGVSNLEFSSKNLDDILYFRIHNSDKNQEYNVEKQVHILNVALWDNIIENREKVGIGIKYRSNIPLRIDKTMLMPGTIDKFYSHQFTAYGGTPPYTFSISGLSESGLNFVNSTGLLSGIPRKTGEYGLKITVTDSNFDKDSYENKLIINDMDNDVPHTPSDILDANNIGWLNGNSGNIHADKFKSIKGVKFKTDKHYEIVLRSQTADFTSPELYFENNLLIQSGATMVLNSNQIVFRGFVELEKKNNRLSGKLCLKGYTPNEDIKIYFVGGIYEGNKEIVKPGTIITVKSACYEVN